MIVTDIKSGKGVLIFSVKGISIFAARRIAICSSSLGGRISLVESTSEEMRRLKEFSGVLAKSLGDFAFLTEDKDIDNDILMSISLLKDRLDSTGMKGLGSYIVPESFLCSAEFAIPIKMLDKIQKLSSNDKVLGSAEIAFLFYKISDEFKKSVFARNFMRGRQGGRRWK